MKNCNEVINDKRSTTYQKGFALLLTVIIVLAVLLLISASFLFLGSEAAKISRNVKDSLRSYYVSEGGIEDAIYRILGGKAYSSVYTLNIGNGSTEVSITSAGLDKQVESKGNFNNRIRKLETVLRITKEDVQFFYGVQIGEGGLEMENNSAVEGSIYSNGDILGIGSGSGGDKCSGHSCISGDAFAAAGVAPSPDVIWDIQDGDFIVGREVDDEDQIDAAQSFRPSSTSTIRRVSFYIKKVGSPSDASILLVKDKSGSPGKKSDDVLTNGTLISSQVSDDYFWHDVSFVLGPTLDSIKTYWIVLNAIENDNNYYIWGIDTSGGYTNGTGKYSDDWNSGDWDLAGGDFNFKTWMGGVDHTINNMVVGGNAHAHNIIDTNINGNALGYNLTGDKGILTVGGNAHFNSISKCIISGDASYNSKANCTVGGTETTPTTPPEDPPPLDMPISEATIEKWKSDAALGGTIAGDYAPPIGSTNYLGPKVITGNMILENNQTLYVTGTIYVQGYVKIDNGTSVKLDSSYGEYGGAIITDNWIHIKNNGEFSGSGQEGSYLMMLTTLEDCNGGTQLPQCTDHNAAIDLHNNAAGVIFYAQDSMIYLHQNITVTELVGYKIYVSQNSEIIYEQGLENSQFSSGPGASREIRSWKEIY